MMQTIIIDKEFRSLLPVLDKETYRRLEENIIENGCRDALVIWNDVLIDGYNRYQICTEHDIPFTTVSKEFGSREETVIWIIATQVSRRNLTAMQLSRYRGMHYRSIKRIQGANKKLSSDNEKGQNVLFNETTAAKVAKQYNVSDKTIQRDLRLADAIDLIGEISPEAQNKILSQEVAISKRTLEALQTGTKEDIEAIAAEIENGTYKRRAPAAPKSTVDNESGSSVIRNITISFESVLHKLNKGDMEAVKPELRAFIDSLEELYRSMITE